MSSNQPNRIGADLSGIDSALAPARMALGARCANRGEHSSIEFACPSWGARATRTAGVLAW